MKSIRDLADWQNPASLGNRMRQKRFEKFRGLVAPLPKPLRILDVGGTNQFWELRGGVNNPDFQITLLNLYPEPEKHDNIRSVTGDATNMPEYGDGSFDIVFSNSVIEHVFTWESQQKMAAEVRRVGRAYWVQTPNFWFPIEPHFHMIGWQWMPASWRYRIIQKRRCGWRGPMPDFESAKQAVDEVRLVSGREMRTLFPTATIWGERVGGLVKSWVAHEGFAA